MKDRGFVHRGTALAAAVLWAVVLLLMTSPAWAEPGQAPTPRPPQASSQAVTATSLAEFFSATGKLSISVDGAGSNAASHIAEVEKPNAAATVRRAFVLAASTGFSGRVLANGDVTINGTGITWDSAVPSAISSSNHLADVTAIVKPGIDVAAPGRIPFTFTEVNASGIEGEILVVVFDDPMQTRDQTIILLFGAQNITGDTFAITLAEPINPQLSGAVADMGLGISFGFQGPSQFSIVEVNGQRLTSAAGGHDDGNLAGGNGRLITVGGLDDTPDNPTDPFAPPNGDPRFDDELYTLLPFITATDTRIAVFTSNPSNDDNIFLAYFRLSAAAIIGEGVVLRPPSPTNPFGTTHTVTARVVNDNGDPVPNRLVTFEVIAGPNMHETGTVTTNSAGEASFTYLGDGGSGLDQIRASISNPNPGSPIVSNVVEKCWSLVGDVNCSGGLDAEDARLNLAVLVGSVTPDTSPAINFTAGGDANADGRINNLDAIVLLGILAGRIPPLPNNTRITATDNGNGTARVAGSAGAVPPGRRVQLANATSGATVLSAPAGTDGHFSATIAAVPGDKIVVAVTDEAGNPGPARIAVTSMSVASRSNQQGPLYPDPKFSVLLGNGDGTFPSQQRFAVGETPEAVTVADVNGDGRPDVLIAVLLGNGDGTLQAAQHFAVGATPLSVTVADVNGDGHRDVLTANFGSDDVSVLLHR